MQTNDYYQIELLAFVRNTWNYLTVCKQMSYNGLVKNKVIHKIFTFKSYIYMKVKLATVVEGDPKAPFSIATTLRCGGNATPFPGFLHFICVYIYIYIVIHRQTVSLCHNSSVWLHT